MTFTEPCYEIVSAVAKSFQRPRFRPMGQFAEEEIYLTTGRYEGRRYSLDRQPYAKAWYEQVDSGRFNEHVMGGPSQSGKTLNGFVIPIMYYLFERRETVIAAAPTQDIVNDKWLRDLRPMIVASQYREFMPAKQLNNDEAKPDALMRFGNGAQLRWMTGGGSDKSRSNFTSRILVVTETDGFDVRFTTSDESNQISQLEARLASFEETEKVIFKECTFSTREGHTWIKYEQNTASRLMLPCPHCSEYVYPEREHLKGWQGATDDLGILENAHFLCPNCDTPWTEEQRRQANRDYILIHADQSIKNGKVVGPKPRTLTLGFRWGAVNNCLVPASNAAIAEFKSQSAIDEDESERKLQQFVHGMPYEPIADIDVTLKPEDVKTDNLGQGQIPESTVLRVIGIDCGWTVLHWTATAWTSEGPNQVYDYGTTGVDKSLPPEQGVPQALMHLHDKFEAGEGWSKAGYDCVVVDVRELTVDLIRTINALKDTRWVCYMGLGDSHWETRNYNEPKKRNKLIHDVGDGWYLEFIPKYKRRILYGHATKWKERLQRAVKLDVDGAPESSSIRLFASMRSNEHNQFIRHLTSEKLTRVFERSKGYRKVFEQLRSQNHWLDSTYMCLIGADRLGYGAKPKRRQAAVATGTAEQSGHGRFRPQTFSAGTFSRRG